MTTVTYHRDGYGPGRPAINVKLHAAGYDLWPPEWFANPPGTSDREAIIEAAYERIRSDFWDDAAMLAAELGLGTIYSEGRSGGWLVIDKDPTYGGEDDAPREWLAAYRALSEWADAYIADAPRKVRDLAQSLAMDAAGERPAYRMFAFERTERLVMA